MNGAMANGQPQSLADRIALYKQMDETRQQEFEELAHAVISLQERLRTAQADLEDEQDTRRAYRRRAEEAESAAQRNQFALVLIDGDSYVFKESFLKAAIESGGADAAHQLESEVQAYLRANNHILTSSDIDVVVNIYANKSGLARVLYDAGMIQHPSGLDSFFQSFCRSKALFQFIDCGPGKESSDAKIRDTYRFYAYSANCRHIFLACCHDNGYVVELDKYRHDPIAAPKTLLVYAAQGAREYIGLSWPVARFGSVFETSTIVARQQYSYNKPQRSSTQQVTSSGPEWQAPIGAELTPAGSHTSSYSSVISPPQTVAALPVRCATTPAKTPPKTPLPEEKAYVQLKAPAQPTGDPKGIPINRAGQRVDRRMRQPTTVEQERFEARIKYRKLCNEHHLRNSCYQYNCKFDHDPVDAEMKNTLRHVARRIPCSTGMKCRRGDCYYGHQCPWGNEVCSNPKCGFIKGGLHDINDLEVCKFVTAALVS